MLEGIVISSRILAFAWPLALPFVLPFRWSGVLLAPVSAATVTFADGCGSEPKSLALAASSFAETGITAMELALNGAAEIAQRVEGRAAARNYCLRFSNEDIRAIGVTMFIQAMREGGIRWQQ
jgi:hypothetical protein